MYYFSHKRRLCPGKIACNPPKSSFHLAVSWFQPFVGRPKVDVVTVVYRVGSNDFVEFVDAALSGNVRCCSSSSHSFLMLLHFQLTQLVSQSFAYLPLPHPLSLPLPLPSLPLPSPCLSLSLSPPPPSLSHPPFLYLVHSCRVRIQSFLWTMSFTITTIFTESIEQSMTC